MGNEAAHRNAIAFSKRWIALFAGIVTLAALASALGGAIEAQAIPFLVCGYFFLLAVPAKILAIAVERRMMEIGGQ